MRAAHHIENGFPVVHHLVELTQLAKSEFFFVLQAPLSPAHVITKVVSLSWEVNPLGVAELVAHEVKVGLSSETDAQESDHLVESHSSADHHGGVIFL